MESLGFSKYSIMSSENKDSFTPLFLIWMLFISFSCLLAVARIFITMLSESGKCRYPCLVPGLQAKAFSFPALSIMCAVGLSYVSFNMLSHVPLYPLFWEFLSWWMLNFVKCFSCLYWDDHMICIFYFVNVVSHIDFVNVELSFHSWNKFHLIMLYDPFNVLLNSVC